MQLSRKVILITVSSFIALVFIVAASSDIILLQSYKRLEQDVLKDTLKKIQNEVEECFPELDASAKDFAETLNASGMSAFSGFDADWFVNHRVDLVAALDASGNIIAVKGADFHKHTLTSVSEAFQHRIASAGKACVKKRAVCQLTGYLTSESTMMQIAIHPLSGGDLLLVGRTIDNEEISRISALTKRVVEFHQIENGEASGEYAEAGRFLLAGNSFYSQVLPDSRIAGYVLFRDIDESPALLMRVSEPRLLYKQGKLSVSYVIFALTLCSALLCLIILFFLRNTVLKRLSTLNEKVRKISKSGEISDRLDVEGDDEMTELSLSINSMLDSLASAEEALKESEERYRSLFDRAPDAILVIGLDDHEAGRIVAANRVAAEQHGYTIEELCSKTIFELNTEETNRIAPAMMAKIMKGNWITQEAWHRKKDGSEFPIEIHAGLFTMGRRRYILGFDRDITLRKLAEKSDRMYLDQINQLNSELSQQASDLEAANRELETFNYSVSHDMRGPLTHISGYCQLLLEEESGIDQQTRTYINRIYSSCCWLDQLIDAMFELSQISKAPYDFQSLNLSKLVQDAITELQLADPERLAEISVQPDVTVTGDQNFLKIAVTNLVNNAWKYSSCKPKTTIEFGVREEQGEPVYFIRDQGAGFDMQQSEKLFRVFTRLHDGSSFKGSGVGLATVQRIIARHGGRIWGEGTPEVGATFFFTLKQNKGEGAGVMA